MRPYLFFSKPLNRLRPLHRKNSVLASCNRGQARQATCFFPRCRNRAMPRKASRENSTVQYTLSDILSRSFTHPSAAPSLGRRSLVRIDVSPLERPWPPTSPLPTPAGFAAIASNSKDAKPMKKDAPCTRSATRSECSCKTSTVRRTQTQLNLLAIFLRVPSVRSEA